MLVKGLRRPPSLDTSAAWRGWGAVRKFDAIDLDLHLVEGYATSAKYNEPSRVKPLFERVLWQTYLKTSYG